jgi:drug/metabolite transporter (DMT)-like permease
MDSAYAPALEEGPSSMLTADTSAPDRRVDQLALGAGLVTVVFWASAFVGIRAAAADLTPGALALGRLIVASIILGLIVAWRRPAWPARRDWLPIIAIGGLWFGIYFLALNAAEREVDAGTAAMLVNVAPILIAILSGLFLGEGFPPRLLIGCVIAFAGVVVISVATSGQQPGGATLLGIGLCFASAVVYSIAVTIQKPLLRRVNGQMVTWLACTVGVIVSLPFLPELLQGIGTAPAATLGWVAYLGIFPTAIAFSTWAYALSHTAAGRLGSLTYLAPAIAIVIGWLVLGEAPAPAAFIGGAIAIGGVIFARSQPSRPAVPAPAEGVRGAA